MNESTLEGGVGGSWFYHTSFNNTWVVFPELFTVIINSTGPFFEKKLTGNFVSLKQGWIKFISQAMLVVYLLPPRFSKPWYSARMSGDLDLDV